MKLLTRSGTLAKKKQNINRTKNSFVYILMILRSRLQKFFFLFHKKVNWLKKKKTTEYKTHISYSHSDNKTLVL